MKRLPTSLFLAPVLLLAGALAAEGPDLPTSLSVQEAVERALLHNRQIKVVRYEPQIAQARWLNSLGLFDPIFTLQRDRERSETPFAFGIGVRTPPALTDHLRLSLDGRTPWGASYNLNTAWTQERLSGAPDVASASASIRVVQPLLKGGGMTAALYEVRLLRADQKISHWEFQQVAIDTVTRVVVACSDLQFAREYLRVTERARELAATLIRENEIRVNAGGMSNNQLLQARARAAARDEAVIVARRALLDADLRLRHVLGETMQPGEATPLDLEPAQRPEVATPQAADLELAWTNRPDVQQARLQRGKKQLSESYARHALMPQLDLVGGYGLEGTGESVREGRSAVLNREFPHYSAGLVLTVPLTWTRERGRLRAARLEREQAEEELARLRQEVALNVCLAAGRLKSAHERISAARAAYALAQEALDDEVKKLRIGASTTFVVLSLQESLSGIEIALQRAYAEERVGAALYERELGRTLVHHGLKVGVP